MEITRMSPAAPLMDASAQGGADNGRTTDREQLAEAAREFEAMFVERMLKAMRATLSEDNPMQGENEDIYRDMLDREIAGSITEREGYGLADALLRQLSPADSVAAPGAGKAPPETPSAGEPEAPRGDGKAASPLARLALASYLQSSGRGGR